MKKKFLINLFLLVVLNLLVKPFWIFGIDRTVQNITGTYEYGFYFSLLNFSLIFNIILDLGIANFNNRSIAKDPSLFRKYFSNIVAVKFFLAVIYTMISMVAAVLFGYSDRQMNLLLFLILNQFIASFILFLRSNISGLQYYTTDSLLSVLDRTIMIILCSMMIWGHIFEEAFKIEYFVYIQTVSYAITAFLIFFVLIRKAGRWIFDFNMKITLEMLKQLVPFAILGFLMAFYSRIDSILLERMLPDGEHDAGIYAQSFRILDAASNFSVLFASLLLPMFSRMIARKEDIYPLLRISFVIMFVVTVAFTITCFTFRKPIIETLYLEGNRYSLSVFSILIFSFIPISVSYIFGTLLTAAGNLKQLNYIALAAVIVNLTMNMILIPNYHAKGSAIASLVTQTGVTLAQIGIFIKFWQCRIKWNEVLRYFIFLVMAVASAIFSVYLPIPWVLCFVTTGVLIILSGFLTGLLPVKNFLKSIRLELRRLDG